MEILVRQGRDGELGVQGVAEPIVQDVVGRLNGRNAPKGQLLDESLLAHPMAALDAAFGLGRMALDELGAQRSAHDTRATPCV